MSADLEALARKLDESGRVPWVRGMVEADGAICQRAVDGVPLIWRVDEDISAAADETALLDLTDDGNRGHLLARARVLRGDPNIHIVGDGITWAAFDNNLNEIDLGYHEEEITVIVALILEGPNP